MQNLQRIYFPANDCHVLTGLCPSGLYGAHIEEEPSIRGYGHTRLAAIANMAEKVPEEEEVDHQAARFDRARDYIKHGAA